ncbi:MAG: hypothetical protein QOF33_4188 [Thermomicrobiales bacterium]|jgi:hypothetical protein|nr:hypothetical protein [Thermomicrobiales bacterium]
MPRQGEDFHKLVAHLERAFAGQSDVSIEAPGYLLDKVTKRLREHDIVLTYRHPHKEVVVAIECRDRSRKVGEPEVEAFHTKCEITGVHKGIIVSSKGFSQDARSLATFKNIDCFTLEQIEQLEWVRPSFFTRIEWHFMGAHVVVHIQDVIPLPMHLYHRLESGDIEEINVDDPSDFAYQVFQQTPRESLVDDQGVIHIELTNPNDFYLTDKNGEIHELSGLSVDIEYKIVIAVEPFTFYVFRDADGSQLYEAAAVKVDGLGHLSGRIMVTKDEKQGTRLHYMRDVPHSTG